MVTAEVPIILVGTYKAAAMLKQETSLARRIAEGGFYQLKRPASPRDENWQALCKVVWKHQWVKEPLAITEEVVRTLYDYSQGITGIMINIFVAAQFHALEEGIETISSSLIKDIYHDMFQPLHHIIDLLRENNPEVLSQYDDLYYNAGKELKNEPLQNRIETLCNEIEYSKSKLIAKPESTIGVSSHKGFKRRQSKRGKPSTVSLHDSLRMTGQGSVDFIKGSE